jgi:hypothetical protein
MKVIFTSSEVVFDIRAYPRKGWLGWLGRKFGIVRLGWVWIKKV